MSLDAEQSSIAEHCQRRPTLRELTPLIRHTHHRLLLSVYFLGLILMLEIQSRIETFIDTNPSTPPQADEGPLAKTHSEPPEFDAMPPPYDNHRSSSLNLMEAAAFLYSVRLSGCLLGPVLCSPSA